MTSIFSGRSRHGRSAVRSSRSKVGSTRNEQRSSTKASEETAEVEPEEAAKPTIEELRLKRLQYLALTPDVRRRLATSAAVKVKQRASTTSHAKPIHSEQQMHKRKRKSSSSRPERGVREGLTRTEDYVYGTISTSPGEERERRHRSHSSRGHERSVQQPREPSRSVASRRSPVKRSNTSSARLHTIPDEHVDEETAANTSRQEAKHRPQSSLFGLWRRNSAPAAPTAPRLVECLTCAADDVPHAKSAKLACGHRMCHDCLRRVFKMSVKDPAHMPPKCCTDQHIPLQFVEKLFDLKFRLLFNRKFEEFNTKNRIYCPTPKCGAWIKPCHMHTSQGRKYAQCPRCSTKVCRLCNGKLHRSKECPKDPEIARLVAQGKEKGWQSCYSCRAMVELKEGCNHMTCRCRAEFCMICGSKWKTCECPWFNYSQLPDPDRLVEWRVAEPIQHIYQRAFGQREGPQPEPRPARRAADAVPRVNQQRGPNYTDEMDQRRRQERLDADLARRLQLASLLDPDGAAEERGRQRDGIESRGLG